MNSLDLDAVCQYVNDNIQYFHDRKIASLGGLTLDRLLKKNPYLFKAKNITLTADLMLALLDAFLSSSEEKLFGDFLEGLAVFVAGQTTGGHKSAAQGVDLEFISRGTHYVVSIKSGPNWGNSSQHRTLAQDLRDAVTRVKQSRTPLKVQPVLGICYGKTKSCHTQDGYWKVVGQNFWYLISENPQLYTDIIEPIGYRAKEHNDAFIIKRDGVINNFATEFGQRFCCNDGTIDWVKLVEYNSGNFDPNDFSTQ
jgi:hypothetical protein